MSRQSQRLDSSKRSIGGMISSSSHKSQVASAATGAAAIGPPIGPPIGHLEGPPIGPAIGRCTILAASQQLTTLTARLRMSDILADHELSLPSDTWGVQPLPEQTLGHRLRCRGPAPQFMPRRSAAVKGAYDMSLKTYAALGKGGPRPGQ